jgi:hypothetical protein
VRVHRGVHLTGLSQAYAPHRRVFRGVHLTDAHLIDIYLTGMHLTGMHLTGVHLTGMHLMDVHLMNMPHSWASLNASASAPKPVSSALTPALKPQRSRRTLPIPGHYAVLAGRSSRKPHRDGNV